jgi:hypothetical protein
MEFHTQYQDLRRLKAIIECMNSTGHCDKGLKFFHWCLIFKGLSRVLIELARGRTAFGLAEA